MAPIRPKKRVSEQSVSSARKQNAMESRVPLKGSPSTPQRSPIKKRKMGVSLHQKQALIDNLQLEITERARRLRAQCNLQSQGLRSRIEIRINRIPMSLRKAKMGDLLRKYMEQEQNRVAGSRPPPVPAKDSPRISPQKGASRAQQYGRVPKRMSGEIARDKENDMEHQDSPKKRARAGQGPDAAPVRPGQVLSPTSSNSRLNNGRPVSPTKSQITRPGSPLKMHGTNRYAGATNALSNMVEKAKATRNGGTRKVTTASNASSSSNATTAATRTRRAAAPPAASKAPKSRPATRTGHRASDHSETSEASNTTVVRNAGTKKAAAPATKKTTMMGTIRKGVTGGAAKKAAATAAKTNATSGSTTGSGRVLRKRG